MQIVQADAMSLRLASNIIYLDHFTIIYRDHSQWLVSI
jgi:hypothetical protein